MMEPDEFPVLDVLGDETARQILLTLGEPLTANEVADTCNVPLSTAYRKLDVLAETGLVSETVRLEETGTHPRAYSRAIVDAHLHLRGDLEVEIETRNAPLAHGD